MFSAVSFDWGINLGNIITIAVILFGILAHWFKMDGRLTSVEKEQGQASDERKDIIQQLRNLTIQVAKLEERIKKNGTDHYHKGK